MRLLVNIAVAVNRNCIVSSSIKYNFHHNTKRLLSLLICFSIGLVEDLLSADINEVDLRESIRRGSQFLYKNQDASGWWSDPDLPALTSLALVRSKTLQCSWLHGMLHCSRMKMKVDGNFRGG